MSVHQQQDNPHDGLAEQGGAEQPFLLDVDPSLGPVMGWCEACGATPDWFVGCVESYDDLNSGAPRSTIPGGRPAGEQYFYYLLCPECGAGSGQQHHYCCPVEVCPGCSEPGYACECAPSIERSAGVAG